MRLTVPDPSANYTNVEATAAGSSGHVAEPHINDYAPEGDPVADAEYEEAVRRSRDEYYGTQQVGETSYSTPLADTGTSSSWPSAVDPNAYELSKCFIDLEMSGADVSNRPANGKWRGCTDAPRWLAGSRGANRSSPSLS